MKKCILNIILVFILIGCEQNKYPHYDLPIDEIFHYVSGDTLIYESSFSHFDTLFVDRVERKYIGDNPFGYSSNFYEGQKVVMHFKKDEASITPSVYWNHDMKIYFNTSSEPEIFEKCLQWKTYTRFSLKDIQTIDSIMINDAIYDNVYILNRDEEYGDSSLEFRTIYFNFKFGILKYDNGTEEIFCLDKVL